MVVVGAPLVIVRRSRGARVVAIDVWRASGIPWVARRMPVNIPAKALARPVKDAVVGLAGIRICGEFHAPAQARRGGISVVADGVILAQDQIPISRQDAHVVAVFVEWMFPAS